MERFRGSWNVPLTEKGVEDAISVGKATEGVWDTIYHSNLGRTTRTAKCVQEFSPEAQLISTPKLRPMRLGGIESREVTTQRIKEMNKIIRESPNKPLPGVSPKSGEPGESLNQFKKRVLSFVKKIEAEMDSREYILLVTHYRDIQLIKSFLEVGEPDDLSIDVEMLLKHGSQKPGDLFEFDLKKRSIDPVEHAKTPGLYIMRHGETAANK